MGFLCRQGRIRLEPAVRLLILIGAMLQWAEGLRCYGQGLDFPQTAVNCRNANACLKVLGKHEGKNVIERRCINNLNQQCVERHFGTGGFCVKMTNQADVDKYNECAKDKTGTRSQNTAEYSLPNVTYTVESLTSQFGRQNANGEYVVLIDYWCVCFTDLCNDGNGADIPKPSKGTTRRPGRRSTANSQVVSAILVAASLFISNIGLGLGQSPLGYLLE